MGTLADLLEAQAPKPSPESAAKAPWEVHENAAHYRTRAVNQQCWLGNPWGPNAENQARKLRENSMRLERAIARNCGTFIVETVIGTENFEYLKARDLTKRVDGFGAVQFKVGKNPNKVTHIEVHQEPEGGYLVKSLRFHKVRQVFEWIFEVTAERTVAPTDDIAVALSTLTGLNMGTVYAYKLQITDPTKPCPTCDKLFGPHAPSQKIKGNDKIFCSLACAQAASIPL